MSLEQALVEHSTAVTQLNISIKALTDQLARLPTNVFPPDDNQIPDEQPKKKPEPKKKAEPKTEEQPKKKTEEPKKKPAPKKKPTPKKAEVDLDATPKEKVKPIDEIDTGRPAPSKEDVVATLNIVKDASDAATAKGVLAYVADKHQLPYQGLSEFGKLYYQEIIDHATTLLEEVA